jgi:hydroxymethylpyrimidine/phosphomethylpyrimidine kinase
MLAKGNPTSIKEAGTAMFPCALTIAGSDSGGNAGIQADLRAFHAYGLHGCTVLTALTAQNPRGVRAVHVAPPAFVAAQLDAVFEMYGVKALKTGMLATADVIEVVAEKLAALPRVKKVIDPVMVATSGAKLLADDAAAALAERLLPLATLITPNLPEAEVLLGDAIETAADVRLAAKTLARKFRCAILVKGGHSADGAAEDVLYDGRRFRAFVRPRVKDPVSTHGTGCTLAAATAAGLALGASLGDAVARAKIYVYEAIKFSYHIGRNCGVLGMPKTRR